MNVKVFIAGILSALVLIVIAFGAYMVGKNSGGAVLSVTPTPQPGSALRVPSPVSLVSPTATPQGASQQSISTAISSGNYSSLSPFMVNPVSVRIEASECCNPMTPDDAAAQLSYLDSAETPWSFDNQDIKTGLEASFPESYGNAIIGVSANNYLVGFQLNGQNFITKVSMASDYHLLLP